MLVREAMIGDVQTIAPDATIDEAGQMMADLDIGALPVAGGVQQLRGILTDRDILVRVVARGRDPRAVRVEEAMSSDLFSCRPEDTVEGVIRAMEEHQVRRMPVLDAEGRMIGLVTIGDLRRARSEGAAATAQPG